MVETFESLLQSHPDVFYAGRSAKALLAHWQQLKQYYLLPDQNAITPTKPNGAREFDEAEEQVRDVATIRVSSLDDAAGKSVSRLAG